MKAGIITIYDLGNIGNRLQNYAIQQYLKSSFNVDAITLFNVCQSNSKKNILKQKIKNIFKKMLPFFLKKRNKAFLSFDKLIVKDSITDINKIIKKYDFFIVGSDQIWNPNIISNLDNKFAEFAPNKKKIAFAPSIGVNSLTETQKNIFKNKLNNFDTLSCREKTGSKLLEEITGKKIPVLLDPTFMLSKKEWMNIEKKPKNMKDDQYVLLYYLGHIAPEYQKFIDNICCKRKLKIIDVLNSNHDIGGIGPSEFIYLIRNSSIVLTDSFHACVFSIIFEKPFVVFDRQDNNKSMESRIINLFEMLKLDSNHKFGLKSCVDNYFDCNYELTNELLALKRKDTFVFFDDYIKKLIRCDFVVK